MNGTVKTRIGERLVRDGIISKAQLDNALREHAVTGEKLGTTLVKLGFISQDDLLVKLCEEAGIPFLTLQEIAPDPAAFEMLPEQIARRYNAVALTHDGVRLVVVMADPFNIDAVMGVERAAGEPVKVVAAKMEDIQTALNRVYALASKGAITIDPAMIVPGPRTARLGITDIEDNRGLFIGAEEQPAVSVSDNVNITQLVDDIIKRGIDVGATDIHIEPVEDVTKVRYRIDGILEESSSQPKSLQAALISRIKILSSVDIAETRLPQDGRLRVKSNGRNIDLRVSTFPTVYGEDIVLRVLDRERVALNLEKLGISPEDLTLLREACTRPFGMIPVTGPTGSGKTTTLYSALLELKTTEQCIITLEDPVEYELPQIRQSQINIRAGLTFASGLRAILRHDPDVILVGEMRDAETVQIALSAALTGHMVLTTLHTTTAAGAIPRLLDMGAEPFVLASSIGLIVSQRLARKLCSDCKIPADIPEQVRERYKLEGVTYTAKGCKVCRGSGYRGRAGIFEILPITEEIVKAIYERRSAEEIHRISGRPTLLDDGLKKVRAGMTSLDEILRIIAA